MKKADVVILGGGMSGSTLALQLHRENPRLRITVLERACFPHPEAAHKVGESTVEIGAHYLSEIVGLQDHLQGQHLRKFGLRFFFPALEGQPFHERREMGTRKFFPLPSYQLDRGILENYLFDHVRTHDITFIDGATVTAVQQQNPGAEVRYMHEGRAHDIATTWLLDASGRSGFMSRRHSLKRRVEHDAHAVWFRLNHRITFDSFSNDASWHAGFEGPQQRWYSTNHFMGSGYWIWLIPLVNNRSSVGIVYDDRQHSADSFRTQDQCCQWLSQREPELAAVLEGELLDFRSMKHLAYDSLRVFSSDNWMLTGDAATFLDPFYSPGMDFIAIANSCITSLICQTADERTLIRHTEILNQVYKSIYSHFLESYTNMYGMFGNHLVMPIKVAWDFAVYWAFIAFFYTQGKMVDPVEFQSSAHLIGRVAAINTSMQKLFRHWHTLESPAGGRGMIDMTTVPFLWYLNDSLTHTFSGDSFGREFEVRIGRLESMAAQISAWYERRTGETAFASWRQTEDVIGEYLEEVGDGCILH